MFFFNFSVGYFVSGKNFFFLLFDYLFPLWKQHSQYMTVWTLCVTLRIAHCLKMYAVRNRNHSADTIKSANWKFAQNMHIHELHDYDAYVAMNWLNCASISNSINIQQSTPLISFLFETRYHCEILHFNTREYITTLPAASQHPLGAAMNINFGRRGIVMQFMNMHISFSWPFSFFMRISAASSDINASQKMSTDGWDWLLTDTLLHICMFFMLLLYKKCSKPPEIENLSSHCRCGC